MKDFKRIFLAVVISILLIVVISIICNMEAEAKFTYGSEFSNENSGFSGYQIDNNGDFHFYNNGTPLRDEYNDKEIYFDTTGKMENPAYRHKKVNEDLSEALENKQLIEIQGVECLRSLYDYYTVNYGFDVCNNNMLMISKDGENYSVHSGDKAINRKLTYNSIKARFGNLKSTTNSSNIEKQLKEKLSGFKYSTSVYRTSVVDTIKLNKIACWQCGKIITTLLEDINIECELLVVEINKTAGLRHVLVRFRENNKWVYLDPTVVVNGVLSPEIISYEYVLKHYTPAVNVVIFKV